MGKGESSREKVRAQILELLLSNISATSKTIVETCESSKATTYKYLDELIDEGLVVWKPLRGRGKDTYELSEKGKVEAKKIEDQRKLNSKSPEVKNFLVTYAEEIENRGVLFDRKEDAIRFAKAFIRDQEILNGTLRFIEAAIDSGVYFRLTPPGPDGKWQIHLFKPQEQ